MKFPKLLSSKERQELADKDCPAYKGKGETVSLYLTQYYMDGINRYIECQRCVAEKNKTTGYETKECQRETKTPKCELCYGIGIIQVNNHDNQCPFCEP